MSDHQTSLDKTLKSNPTPRAGPVSPKKRILRYKGSGSAKMTDTPLVRAHGVD
jgi:hypothetical protein